MKSHVAGLRFGPIGATAAHLCIDMQLMFAKDTKWASSAVAKVLPVVTKICGLAPSRTIFTRFLTPHHLKSARRQWRRFYRESPSMLANNLKPEHLEIVPQLRPFLAQAHVVDRYVFSAFAAPELARHLEELGAETTIFTGIESDVCVLATALAAIDRGYRVIIVEDGVASSRPSAHRAVMQHVLPRFDQQVEIVKAATLARNWHAGKK